MNFDQSLIKKDPIYKKFQDHLNKFLFLKENDKIVVSISGGLDSVTLLIMLYTVQKYRLVNVHVNHNLHKDSDKYNLFVKKISNELDIPFYSKELYPHKKNKSKSTEEWARIERYSFLNNIAEKTNSKYIMTAHHGNDQVETLLMNLSRKTGVSGLKGIAKVRGKIIRPMLNLTKKEIIKFSNRINFCFIEDPTNLDISIPRNFLRHNIIKPWEMNFPQMIQGVIKSMQYFDEWAIALDYLIIEFIVPKLIRSKKEFVIPYEFVRSMPKIVRIRLIKILTDNQTALWSKHQFELINHFLNKNYTGNLFYFSNGWAILHDRKEIIGKKNYVIKEKSLEIYPNEKVVFNNCEFEIHLTNKSSNKRFHNKYEIIDWSKIKNKKLEIRTWKKGDAFQPLGMKGRQKISDFLINEKVDRISKSSQYVLTADEEIFWVCGKRISNWARITKETLETATLIYKSI